MWMEMKASRSIWGLGHREFSNYKLTEYMEMKDTTNPIMSTKIVPLNSFYFLK